MTSFRRRLLVATALAALAAAVLAAPSQAGTRSFFVGTDEDGFLWGNTQQDAAIAGSLGLRAVHVTLQWQPGETTVPAQDQAALSTLQLDAGGLRIVVSVYGAAADAPQTDAARTQYCGFVADLLRRNPEIGDVVIWNDPNDGTFWLPQFAPDGTSLAPAAYEALLADCWDAAHTVNPGVNVISAAVSKSSDVPGAFTLAWHPPAIWIREVADAYKASGRARPIFDTFGYVPHPVGSAERPWTTHPDSAGIAIGDYDELMADLTTAYGGTGQPIPGQGSTTIWYLEQGYQTVPDPAKASLYTGTETDPSPLPAWSPNEASDPREGPGVDQAMQLEDAIAVAYCQPNVGAYFNFHLDDERDLAGWQSGVFWADGTPKASYQALRAIATRVNTGAIDCGAFSAGGAPPLPAAVQQPSNALTIANLRVSSLSAFGGTVSWQTSNPATVRVGYGLADGGFPTIWAPVGPSGSSQLASLVGLAPATAYRVWLSAIGDDGQQAQATIDLTTPGLPAYPAVSIGTPVGTLMLDGQPFFPMIVYSACPYQYAADLASGINLFALNACGSLQAQLNALDGAAYSAGVAGGRGGNGPGLIGWFNVDEPDGTNIPASALPGPPAGVPPLSFLTLTNHFYTGAAPLPWGRGMYPALIAKANVVGFDLYPLQEWCAPSRLADVFYAQRQLVRLAGQKPTFQWIEADDWKCPGGPTAVTPATVRAESWLAIAGGAHGLGFWPAEWPSGSGRAIAAVARDVARVGPAVYMSSTSASDSSPQVEISARTWAGALYVFAVNSGYGPADETITVPSLNGRALTVIDEGRRIASVGDSFRDHFAPLAVHLYVAAPPAS